MRVWRAVGGGYAGEAKCAEVSEFAVLEPAVAVWRDGAAYFAVGGC